MTLTRKTRDIVFDAGIDINTEIEGMTNTTYDDTFRHLAICNVNLTAVRLHGFGLTPEEMDMLDEFEIDQRRRCNQLPEDMTFTEETVIVIAVYLVLFAISAAGNFTVFSTMVQGKLYRKSRINLLMMHLSVADLMVTVILIPIEVFWRITITWRAGNVMCRLVAVARTFGLYLSTFVLVCISLDRYFAICHPLSVSDSKRRAKKMLIVAWVLSVVCSLPQAVIFHVMQHPDYDSFYQCVTFGSFRSDADEIAYNVGCTMIMYVIPLLIMITLYSCILCKVISRDPSSNSKIVQYCFGFEPGTMPLVLEDVSSNGSGSGDGAQSVRNSHVSRACMTRREAPFLRRSDATIMARAKLRTLKMTIIIITAFVLCWTPYYTACIWAWVNPRSLDEHVKAREALFIFAVSNSCVNPIVYGTYIVDLRRKLQKLCACVPACVNFFSFTNTATQMSRHSTLVTLASTGGKIGGKVMTAEGNL